MRILCLALLSATMLASGAAQAQSISPGVIDREQTRRTLEDRIPSFLDQKPAEVKKSGGDALEGGKNTGTPLEDGHAARELAPQINRVVFYGNTVMPQSVLDAIASKYTGRSFTEADLTNLKAEVQKAYHERGYVLVRAVTIPQDLSQGLLRIDVHEVRVGEFNKADSTALRPEIVNAFMKPVKTGEVYNEHNVEDSVADLNDLEGVRASMALKPGKQFATTDMILATEEVDEDVQNVTVDNYGSELTGEYIATLNLEKSNLLHLGERYHAQLRASNDKLYSAQAGVETPIGVRNLKAEVTGMYSQNEIGDRLKSLDAEGSSYGLNTAISGNVFNTPKHKGTLRGGLDMRHHESQLAGVTNTEDDIRQLYAQGEYLRREDTALIYASATVSRNLDSLGATDDGDALRSRLQSSNDYWLFRPTAYVSYRPIRQGLDGEFRMFGSAQIASAATLSSDLFSLGGYGSVRGAPLAQETGEAGAILNVEYLHNVWHDDKTNVAFGPFFDAGKVWNRVDGQALDDTMYSVGLGLEAKGDYISAGQTMARLDFAHALGDYDSPEVDDNVFYFRLGQNF